MQSVNAVLDEIDCGRKPTLLVLNKIDAIKDISQLEMIETVFPEAVSISAKSGLGLDALSRKVAEYYRGGDVVLRVRSHQSNGKIQSFLRAHGRILNERYGDSSVIIEVKMGQNQLPNLQRLKPDTLEIVGN
jgi:GTP-binding protein HflX